ncbi:hypothetical protein JEQ12_013308 [Ovis aries]|uniref:Uncharacterized protein n=1 Tax=Ovis aries TaxID=9940 RepID=A0A835ZIT1_SHEEP|nr:hypothetical protein JEQ12_013308 [Ovis aries]
MGKRQLGTSREDTGERDEVSRKQHKGHERRQTPQETQSTEDRRAARESEDTETATGGERAPRLEIADDRVIDPTNGIDAHRRQDCHKSPTRRSVNPATKLDEKCKYSERKQTNEERATETKP